MKRITIDFIKKSTWMFLMLITTLVGAQTTHFDFQVASGGDPALDRAETGNLTQLPIDTDVTDGTEVLEGEFTATSAQKFIPVRLTFSSPINLSGGNTQFQFDFKQSATIAGTSQILFRLIKDGDTGDNTNRVQATSFAQSVNNSTFTTVTINMTDAPQFKGSVNSGNYLDAATTYSKIVLYIEAGVDKTTINGGSAVSFKIDNVIQTAISGVDGDSDGFDSVATGGTDCDDTNGAINTSATEIIGTDSDENCNGYLDDGLSSTDFPLNFNTGTNQVFYERAEGDDAHKILYSEQSGGTSGVGRFTTTSNAHNHYAITYALGSAIDVSTNKDFSIDLLKNLATNDNTKQIDIRFWNSVTGVGDQNNYYVYQHTFPDDTNGVWDTDIEFELTNTFNTSDYTDQTAVPSSPATSIDRISFYFDRGQGNLPAGDYFEVDNFEYLDGILALKKITDGDAEVVSEKYFNLLGQEVASHVKGILVKKQILSNGTVKSIKIFR